MDKNTLNKAIFMVATTQFKKDAKAYHVIVEEAGYTITKDDGCFKIRNKDTQKVVWVTQDWDYRRKHYYLIHLGYGRNKRFYDGMVTIIPFDFVAYLNKPLNMTWYEMTHMTWHDKESKAYKQYNRLTSAKNSLKYAESHEKETKKEIQELFKKIESLQNDLIRYTKEQSEAKENIKRVREEIGLKEV